MEFNSIFSAELVSYISIREKSVGNDAYRNDVRLLQSFDNHLVESKITERRISEEVMNTWLQKQHDRGLAPRTAADQLGYVRNFLRYLQFFGVEVFLPTNPKIRDSYVPYLFSEDEIKMIIQEADALANKRGPVFRAMPMILRMLIGCGFRIGELLNIHIGDIDFPNQTILLKTTKNNKQRIVPISDSLSSILVQYCNAMKIADDAKAYLFPSKKRGNHISVSSVNDHFIEILKKTGIYISPVPHTRGQCIHCLRHVFTVRAFAQGEKSGRHPMDSIPYLSVFLGHYDMDATEKYLKFSGDMFPEYSLAFEDYSMDVFSEVDYEE